MSKITLFQCDHPGCEVIAFSPKGWKVTQPTPGNHKHYCPAHSK